MSTLWHQYLSSPSLSITLRGALPLIDRLKLRRFVVLATTGYEALGNAWGLIKNDKRFAARLDNRTADALSKK